MGPRVWILNIWDIKYFESNTSEKRKMQLFKQEMKMESNSNASFQRYLRERRIIVMFSNPACIVLFSDYWFGSCMYCFGFGLLVRFLVWEPIIYNIKIPKNKKTRIGSEYRTKKRIELPVRAKRRIESPVRITLFADRS